MLLVVFGAGASYDSNPDVPPPNGGDLEAWRPPLAAQLFERRETFAPILARYPVIGPVAIALRAGSDGLTLEQRLEDIRTEADSGTFPHVQRQMMALRYYLRSLFIAVQQNWDAGAQHATTYSALMDLIEKWRLQNGGETVALVTFNYDELLEIALRFTLGIAFPNPLAYAQPPYPLFKLHGSVGWQRATLTPRAAALMTDEAVIAQADRIRLDPDGVVAGPQPVGIARAVYVPAIAIPTRSKTEFECPSEHLEQLRRLLPTVDRVLIVGWRGGDAHFLRLWNDALPRDGSAAKLDVCVVAGGEAAGREVIRSLVTGGLPVASSHATSTGFSSATCGTDVRDWLRG